MKSFIRLALVIVCLVLSLSPTMGQTFPGTPITINDNSAATPYPSTALVSGITDTVTNVTVTITNFSHEFPDDVGALLVGPLGQAVILFNGPGTDSNVVNLTWTFTDSAGSALPNVGALVSGTFQPGQDEYPPPLTVFDAPAPGTYGGALSVFNGTDVNGTWSLYVQDFIVIDEGSIEGWSITFETAAVPEPAAMVAFGATVLGGLYYLRRRKLSKQADMDLTRKGTVRSLLQL